MNHKVKLEEIEDRWFGPEDSSFDADDDVRYLINRVKELTEALEKILEEADGPYSCITARKALREE